MTRYRKRPVEIEAYHFTWQDGRTWAEGGMLTPSPSWLAVAINNGTVFYQGGDAPYFTIRTLEGEMRAELGDWIIKGVKGEIYPCKPDIFAATYDPVEPAYTTGHCQENKKPGGCQLPNVHCGSPECDRRPV